MLALKEKERVHPKTKATKRIAEPVIFFLFPVVWRDTNHEAMATHVSHDQIRQVYFCTVTCYKWLNLIAEADAYNSVYRWFEHLKKDGCAVVGFVIMPNHFHVLLLPTHCGASLNLMIGECKRFMAYDIVNNLRRMGKDGILEILEKGVSRREKLIRKAHQVFRPSFDARLCDGEWMIEQKLDYIHHNPVKGKWNLIDDFTRYPHSSAAFYELGEKTLIDITHYKDLH